VNRPLPIADCQFPIGSPPVARRALFVGPGAARALSLSSRLSRIGNRQSAVGNAAFTLLEILVAVGLLSVIVLGLFAMFNQTQRAFRQGMNQTDILEAGRAVTEMVPRELEQMTPSRYPVYPYPHGVNFYAAIPNSTPLTQPLVSSTLERTNVLEDCFMLLRQNQTWIGIGYLVRNADANGRLWYPETEAGKMGAGTLYRFAAALPAVYNVPGQDSRNGLEQDPSRLFDAFRAVSSPGSVASATVSNRICEGVIHFRFRAFDTNGVLITPFNMNPTNMVVSYSPVVPGEIGLYTFCSNALPASVEMELGLLEQYAWDRYNSIGSPAARRAYLRREEISSRVHLFRQRVPIRNVDPSAYR
jgi:type II secretory pathway pseudopilin PulG